MSTAALVCPWCEREIRDAWEIEFPGGETDVQCGSCERWFHAEREIVSYYTTTREPVRFCDGPACRVAADGGSRG